MKKLVITCLLALLVLPAAAWSAVLPNAGFEGGFTNGIADGWFAYKSDSMVAGTIERSKEEIVTHSGLQAQLIDITSHGSATGGIGSVLDTVAGQTFSVSVWVFASHSDAAYIGIHKGGVLPDENGKMYESQLEWSGNNAHADHWDQLTYTGVATGNKTTVLLYAWGGGTVIFDDFEPAAAPVPEPSSVLALGTGLMGLAGFVVRRRK